MSGCPSADLLERLLAEELTEAVQAEVEQHVQACPTCQNTLERLTTSPASNPAASLSLHDEEAFLVGLMHTPPSKPVGNPASITPAVTHQFAGFELLAELGRGVSGVVYRARQLATGQVVALKVLRAQARANTLVRFRREVDALAWLKHPNLVRVHEVGEWRGRPYLAMEYVAGGSLDKKLAAGPLPPVEAVRLVSALARGVHAAHECGIIHRDLKPANILLSREPRVQSREPEADGLSTLDSRLSTPKIADFGLAKHLDDTEELTASGAILGTPNYMAPEQAEGKACAVGPGADVYSLGAILYQALTGRPPHQGPSVPAVLEMVRSRTPAPLRQLRPDLPAALERVCAICLHKDPACRFSSARTLADELDLFLAQRETEPETRTTATPNGGSKPAREKAAAPIVRMPAAYRRPAAPRRRPLLHPVAWFGICASIIGVGVALLVLGAGWVPHGREAAAPTQQQADAGPSLWEQNGAANPLPADLNAVEPARADEAPVEQPGMPPEAGPPAPLRRDEFVGPLLPVERPDADAGPPWREVAHLKHDAGVRALVFTLKGKALFLGGEDGAIRWWDMDQRKGQLAALRTPVHALALAPDGQTLASVARDGVVRLHRIANANVLAQSSFGKAAVNCPDAALAYSPDGRMLAAGCLDTVRFLDATTAKPLFEARVRMGTISTLAFVPEDRNLVFIKNGRMPPPPPPPPRGAPPPPPPPGALHRAFGFGGLGHALAVGSADAGDDPALQVIDVPFGRPLRTLPAVSVTCTELSARDQVLAMGGLDRTVRLWDATAAGRQFDPLETPAAVSSLAFAPDSRALAVGCADGTIQVWNWVTGERRASWQAHQDTVTCLRFTPDGQSLVSGSADAHVILWKPPGRN